MLSRTSGVNPDATDTESMRARGDARKQFTEANVTAHHDADLYGDQAPGQVASQNSYFDHFNNRDVGGLDHLWSPFFEAMQEAPERLTGKPGPVGIGGLSALQTDPLSIRVLRGGR